MGMAQWIVVGWAAWAAVFGSLGAWIACQRDRKGEEGFILGALFGPLGVLVELLLPPAKPPDPSQPGWHGFTRAADSAAKPKRWTRPLRPLDE
jgi:hypothetical protein